MNATLVKKMLPTALVLGVGVYLVWPYLGADAASAPAAAAEAPSEIAEALLRPKPSALPARNPYKDPDRERARSRELIVQRLDVLKRQLVEARARRDAARKSPQAVLAQDVFTGLTLNATYSLEGGGSAVINGKVYSAGENVRPDRPKDPVVLSRIGLHSVVLRHDAVEHELKYKATVPSRDPGKAPAAPRAVARRAAPRAAPAAPPARAR